MLRLRQKYRDARDALQLQINLNPNKREKKMGNIFNRNEQWTEENDFITICVETAVLAFKAVCGTFSQ